MKRLVSSDIGTSEHRDVLVQVSTRTWEQIRKPRNKSAET